MNQQSLFELDRILQESALDLFKAYQVPVDRGCPEGGPAGELFSASLGFTHPDMQGAVILTLGRCLLAGSLPGHLPDPDKPMLADWAGELANQLMGRMKRKLAAFGLDVVMSTPVVIHGMELDRYPQKGGVCRFHCFGSSGSSAEVLFQAQVPDDYELRALERQPESLAEGDIALF